MNSAGTRRRLSKEEHKDTLSQLATEIDKVVCQIGLDFGLKMIEELGKDGFAKLSKELSEMGKEDKDAQLYRTTDGKYKDVSADASYRQSGEKFAADVKASYPPNKQQQPVKTLLELLVCATADEASFKANVHQLGEASGAEVLLSDIKGSSLKGILRLMEKGILKALQNKLKTVDFSDIRDVLRAMLVCGNKDTDFDEDTAIAVKAQDAVYRCETLSARRSKCRLVGESKTEWRDELVNLEHTTGKHSLLVEVQIVRSKMLLQRASMGGHDGYDVSRGLRGLYEVCLANGYVDASDRKLSKEEQKKIDAIISKRDAMFEMFNLQIQAIRDGGGDVGSSAQAPTPSPSSSIPYLDDDDDSSDDSGDFEF